MRGRGDARASAHGMRPGRSRSVVLPQRLQATAAIVALACTAAPALADSSTSRLAAYYDRQLAICGGDAYAWSGRSRPVLAVRGVAAVGVGRDTNYALGKDGRLRAWRGDPGEASVVLDRVAAFAAGDSGVLAIRDDRSLWHVPASGTRLGRRAPAPVQVAVNATAASVGDGTDYYVAGDGSLFARGNAHRGQFGTGRLERSDDWVRVAGSVADVKSHTGHALLLTDRGEVQGTGGNIYGPLGRHGLGDRAVTWGPLFADAAGIATGASHSAAVRADGSLWIWGRDESPDPRKAMDGVAGVAAGADVTVALARDGSLWQWRTGQRPAQVFACPP